MTKVRINILFVLRKTKRNSYVYHSDILAVVDATNLFNRNKRHDLRIQFKI